MDPHNDFDKHDRAPYDIAPATNTAYAAMRQQRDDLLAAVMTVYSDPHLTWPEARAKLAVVLNSFCDRRPARI